MTLYAFIRVAQGMCIAAYLDSRLYTKEDHWGFLVPLQREVVDAVSMLGLVYFLSSSEFEDVHRSSLVRSAIGCAAFAVDWDAVADEAEHQQELFCLYDYGTGRVYACDK